VKKFKDFLLEETSSNNKAHDIDHLMFHGGHDGVNHTANMLDALHNHFLGKPSSAGIIMKYNGFPVSFGKDKKNRFFVAHDPEFPSYSKEDIDRIHKNDPATANKLKAAYEHLSKITPDEPGKYDGKMFLGSQITKSGGKTKLLEESKSYSVPSNSPHGMKLANAKVAISVEAKHNGTQFDPLHPKERSKFKDHPDVMQIDPTLPANKANYTPEDQQAYLNNRKQLELTYAKSKPEMFDVMEGHGHKISKHIEEMKQQGVPHSFDTYMQSLTSEPNHTKLAERAITNKKHFEDALKIHALFENGKNILANVMHKNETFTHHEGDEPVEPETALVHMHKGESKGTFAKFRRT
jgi:hypothetical protein